MLNLRLDTVAWIILKAREFDVKDADTGDGVDTENAMGVLEDREDDPVDQELATWITDLTDTQRAELVALFWLGRDNEEAGEFPRLLEEARANLDKPTAPYLLGSPMLGDWLEEGLEILGYDTSEIESEVA